nr:HAMP domain-containing sensor histidine kinase [Aphanothece sacrum]
MNDEIEALKQELEQTKLAYQMAVQLSQFKSGFLAKTSHELRSPLSTLMGLHQLILSDLCENHEEEREFIEQAYKSAQKLLNTIDQIVTISKIDYSRIDLKNQVISVANLLETLYNFTHLQAINYNLQIIIETPNPDCYIHADSERLLQGLIILVETGISLIKRGTIKIFTSINKDKNLVKITVDIPCSMELWQSEIEPLEMSGLTLNSLKEWSQKLDNSPGMKCLLCQTLLKKMGGQLNLIDLSPQCVTRLQCLIPWSEIPESV